MVSAGGYGAVLFDRDGTLIEDVPYLGDPAAVRPMPHAVATVTRARGYGLKVGVVTNQSGVGRGLVDAAQLAAVRRRVEQFFGPFDTWQTCPHTDADECQCRKPRPGLVFAAAAELGVALDRCVVVGDIGADIIAAQTAGAAAVLVPTDQTRAAEVAAAPVVAADLAQALDWIRSGHLTEAAPITVADGAPLPAPAPQESEHVLAVRPDSAGDVLVTGPAIRAIAARAARVTLWCGSRGRAAAELLPGIDELFEAAVPWLDPRPTPVNAPDVEALTGRLRDVDAQRAVIFTSFHQSALPTALVLRLAGIDHVSAISTDYPGSLLTVRHQVDEDLPEPTRALSLAQAAGYPAPPCDDGRLRVRGPLPDVSARVGRGSYVVLHPGSNVPARACPPQRCAEFVADLRAAGWRVLVTGGRAETALTAYVAGQEGEDLGGRLTFAELAAVLAGADCLVVGNTGPAHLAAAVGTPVVSLFAPTVPFARWGPHGVPVVRLGDAMAPCRDTRATICPVPGHPCLSTVTATDVVAAVEKLTCES
ncbi:MAG TPA: HAD-IIIA family hydrolase [Micromonosporaceae bacterium]|jgi:histidinol-phosphate phosphatase family protein